MQTPQETIFPARPNAEKARLNNLAKARNTWRLQKQKEREQIMGVLDRHLKDSMIDPFPTSNPPSAMDSVPDMEIDRNAIEETVVAPRRGVKRKRNAGISLEPVESSDDGGGDRKHARNHVQHQSEFPDTSDTILPSGSNWGEYVFYPVAKFFGNVCLAAVVYMVSSAAQQAARRLTTSPSSLSPHVEAHSGPYGTYHGNVIFK